MDKFTAITIWEREKAKLLAGGKKVDSNDLVLAIPHLDNRKAIWDTLLAHQAITSSLLRSTLNNLRMNGYTLSVHTDTLVKHVKNKRLLLNHVTPSLVIGLLDKLTVANTPSFMLAEDYLRNSKQRRTKLYKHIVNQLDATQIPIDYTRSEWNDILVLHKHAKSASTHTSTFIPYQHHTLTVDGITYICSYTSIIAIKKDNLVLLGEGYDYSKSTSKHLSNYLCTTNEATERVATQPDYIYLPLLTKYLNAN